ESAGKQDRAEDLGPGSAVMAAAAEDVLAVERELDGPGDAREDDRYRREREYLSRSPVRALRAGRLRAEMKQRSAEPVNERPVDPSSEECPYHDEQPVVIVVVDEVARGARRERPGDAGEDDDRQHG